MLNDDIYKIRQEGSAADRDRSIRWYQSRIRNLRLQQGNPLTLNTARNSNSVQIGKMYLFVYDPKWKEKLPYYDIFPLVLPYRFTENGFRGLNLHYIPPVARVRVLEELIDISSLKKLTPSAKLKLSWRFLESSSLHPLIEPCAKEYLYSHVRSSFMNISAPEWKIAALLPLENFQKKTRLGVFQKSRR